MNPFQSITVLILCTVLLAGCAAGFLEHQHDKTQINQLQNQYNALVATENTRSQHNATAINNAKKALSEIENCGVQ